MMSKLLFLHHTVDSFNSFQQKSFLMHLHLSWLTMLDCGFDSCSQGPHLSASLCPASGTVANVSLEVESANVNQRPASSKTQKFHIAPLIQNIYILKKRNGLSSPITQQ